MTPTTEEKLLEAILRTGHGTMAFPEANAQPIDWELLFCSHVLDLPSLHWGCWKETDALTLDNFRRAQHRFRRRVVAEVPLDATRVLDVGCGRGDSALVLAERGHEVTAIAPIANYARELSTLGPQGVTFIQTDIENISTATPFDTALFSESCGYFPITTTFRKCRTLVATGGHVIVANMFRLDDTPLRVARHRLSDFVEVARSYGFREVRRIDITQEVLPTALFFSSMVRRHAIPAIGFARFWIESHRGLIGAFFRITASLSRPRLNAALGTLEHYAEQLDPDRFARHARYMILTFQRD